jgi:hypothetical protein
MLASVVNSRPIPVSLIWVLTRIPFNPSLHPAFTPLSFPLFSYTYKLPNLQALCFDIHANWWGVYYPLTRQKVDHHDRAQP